jgi:hypothetical protein
VRQTQLEAELKELAINASSFNKKIAEKTIALQQVKKELSAIQSHNPTVTEHALLRYIERVMKIDLADIKDKILSESNKEYINKLRTCKIPVDGKYKLVVKDKTVVTIETL